MKISILILLILLIINGCTPYVISRIGKPDPARPFDCEIEILGFHEKPDKPYQELGIVQLSNCPDYKTLPCSGWLRKAACELGGHVAYPLLMASQDERINYSVTFQIMVAKYHNLPETEVEVDQEQ